MSEKIWYGDDFARDLGFSGMTPGFWKWCKKHGLEPTHGSFGFDDDDVQKAVQQARVGVR